MILKIQNYYKKVIEYISKIYKDNKYLKKPLLILCLIYLIAFSSIIRANFNYIDDIGRVMYGYSKYGIFSRFMSNYSSTVLHTSTYLTDISPFTQLLSIFMLSLSGVILLKLFNNNKKISFLATLAVLPIGLNPYFLECISYKFDCPYMSLSILVSILPFLFYGNEKKQKIIFSISIFIGTLIMCMTYQASSGIIPLITIFLSVKYLYKKEFKEFLKFLLITLLSFLLGILFYQNFIMVPVDSYVSSSIFTFRNLFSGYISNLENYYVLVKDDFRPLWLILIAIIGFLFIIKREKKSNMPIYLQIIIRIIVIFISLLLAFGLYPFLQKPSFYPRAMYGIGTFIALLCVNITNNKNKFNKIFPAILCYCFIILALTYGNCLAEQKKYIDFRIESVVDDLNELPIMKNDNYKTVLIKGYTGHAPSIDNLYNTYKIMCKLVPSNFGQSWWWGAAIFATNYKIKNITIMLDGYIPNNLSVYKDTMYHKIENNENFILITLK